MAVSRVGCGELSLTCSSVTAKSPRSCYIVSMPTNLHRYYGAGYSHFITTSCYQRRPLLGTPRSRDLFLEVMEQIRQRHPFVVVGYAVMPACPSSLHRAGARKSFTGAGRLETNLRSSAATRTSRQNRCPDKRALEGKPGQTERSPIFQRMEIGERPVCSQFFPQSFVHARSLRPLVKTRAFGMTPCMNAEVQTGPPPGMK